MFNYKWEEKEFKQIFIEFIERISHNKVVRKAEIVSKAVNSKEFRPLFEKLKLSFSEDIVFHKIVNKVRTLGAMSKCNSSEFSLNSEQVCKIPTGFNISNGTVKFLQRPRTKSIFSSQQDELLFRIVFSKQISLIVNRQTVTRKDILYRAKHEVFQPVMANLVEAFSKNAYNKLIDKVRSVGYSKRPR